MWGDCKGKCSLYLTIKSARSQQSSIQDIRSVGGSKDNDSCVALKAVHLCQQLVDGLLTLIVATTHASTTLSANSVNLINEDNAGSLGLCLHQQQVLSNSTLKSSKVSARIATALMSMSSMGMQLQMLRNTAVPAVSCLIAKILTMNLHLSPCTSQYKAAAPKGHNPDKLPSHTYTYTSTPQHIGTCTNKDRRAAYLLKEISDTGSTHTNKQLYKL